MVTCSHCGRKGKAYPNGTVVVHKWRGRQTGNHWLDSPARVDRGHGVFTIPFVSGDNEKVVGVIVGHQHADAVPDDACVGSVLFDIPENAKAKASGRPVWTLVSEDPLTLQPSIAASSGPNMEQCLHGYITNGEWVPC